MKGQLHAAAHTSTHAAHAAAHTAAHTAAAHSTHDISPHIIKLKIKCCSYLKYRQFLSVLPKLGTRKSHLMLRQVKVFYCYFLPCLLPGHIRTFSVT